MATSAATKPSLPELSAGAVIASRRDMLALQPDSKAIAGNPLTTGS